MNKPILFINREDSTSDQIDDNLRNQINYSDKATLIQMINTLLDSNDSLRKYIELLEKNHF